MITLEFEPLATVIGIFHRHFPDRSASVRFTSGIEDGVGYTLFPDDGSDPVIVLDCSIPFEAVVETLAHELAHVAAPDDEHGSKWEAAFEMIHREYCKAVNSL
jgi:hypothetical protein